MAFPDLPKQNKNLVNELEEKAKIATGPKREICLAITENNVYRSSQIVALLNATHKFYKTSVYDVKSVDEFWCDELKSAVKYLIGEEQLNRLIGITEMMSHCQFSHSSYRRSYHSSDIGCYVEHFFSAICRTVDLYTYGMSLKEIVLSNKLGGLGVICQLAYELQNNNKEFVPLVKEAILGDNDKVRLSYAIITAIIISGNEELIEDLTKLLLAAKLQEGVRQEILENADAGSVKTFSHFLKVIADNDLIRYSSVKRAFFTWSGIDFDADNNRVIKKALNLAIKYLNDENERENAINSSDELEVYFSMWATANINLEDAFKKINILAESIEKYKILLALYFAKNTDNAYFGMKVAEKFLDERDEEILAWVCINLATNEPLSWYGWEDEDFEPTRNVSFPSEVTERKKLFNSLSEIAKFIGKKNKTFKNSVFPWANIALENKRVISSMISIVCYDLNEELIEKLMEFVCYMDSDQRRFVYSRILNPKTNSLHRSFLRDALFDKSVYVKEIAVKKLSQCSLLHEDVEKLTDALKSKSSDLRQAIIETLKNQNDEFLSLVIDILLNSKNTYQVQAGIELLTEIKDENEKLFNEKLPLLEGLKEVSTQTEILLDKVIDREDKPKSVYTEENGFGLYNPESEEFDVKTYVPKEKEVKGIVNKIKNFRKQFKETSDFISKIPNREECLEIFEKVNSVFEKHANYEYEYIDCDGVCTKTLFGDCGVYPIKVPAQFGQISGYNDEKLELHMVPFYEEFIKAVGYSEKDAATILCVLSYCYIRKATDTESWFDKAYAKLNKLSIRDELTEKYGNRKYQIVKILELMVRKADKHSLFEFAFNFYKNLLQEVDPQNWGKLFVKESFFEKYPYRPLSKFVIYQYFLVNFSYIRLWREYAISFAVNDEDFKELFMYERFVELFSCVPLYDSFNIQHIFRAYELKLISKDVVYYELIASDKAPKNLELLTRRNNRKEKIFEKYPSSKEIVNSVVKRIVDVESLRGELETPLTPVARNIYYFEGIEYFAKLLSSLGKESFYRGYDFTIDSTKKCVLSFLLRNCYPAESDTPEVIKNLINSTDITEKRLAEASVYAPQWAGLVEEAIGWKGLKSAVWLFHAHINETFSAEKETEVALYSPISSTEFKDGAFDKDWFFDAYNTLGEKRFDVLYKSAKYITSGSTQHRRSQLYADAVLGKLDKDELEKEITDKRNQEKLRCYPLIPFDKDNVDEALHRYLFIQKFLKESKQFGAQRRESESIACNIALRNLAITTGFMDVNRMTWFLESQKFESIKHLMSPIKIDDIEVYIAFDESGIPKLVVKKGDRILKSLPKAYAKNETVLTIKDTVKELKEQHKRARQSFENAMAEETEFSYDELLKLMTNPVLSPMVKSLVWMSEDKLGFLIVKDDKLYLKDDNDEESSILNGSFLKIAHPYDFAKREKWSSYQQYLFVNKIVQPFKQVFREFYPITEDELQEGNISRRYAGNQIQPRRTIALLRNRGWTVDYEDGLQKVYYRENLVLRMYALADWFSPADIEAPTIETVSFFDRKTDERVDFKDVSPIVFSESMRDIDLVVSVAHIGGVDPEASHSTVEMRIAIVTELLKLMKINNVSFVGSHAKIMGKLGKYSVHMGSGVVHAEAVGAVSILPVHSQHRGRIFLPFADDDAKTAEIVSKILLLAEDEKIKDASILSQIIRK